MGCSYPTERRLTRRAFCTLLAAAARDRRSNDDAPFHIDDDDDEDWFACDTTVDESLISSLSLSSL